MIFVCLMQANCSASSFSAEDEKYIQKYLPELWLGLKQANAEDVRLLTLSRLQRPSKDLFDAVKEVIVTYLMSIKPVAMVRLTETAGENCSVKIVKQHVDVLRYSSTIAFRCLRAYKIAISKVYVDAPEVTEK